MQIKGYIPQGNSLLTRIQLHYIHRHKITQCVTVGPVVKSLILGLYSGYSQIYLLFRSIVFIRLAMEILPRVDTLNKFVVFVCGFTVYLCKKWNNWTMNFKEVILIWCSSTWFQNFVQIEGNVPLFGIKYEIFVQPVTTRAIDLVLIRKERLSRIRLMVRMKKLEIGKQLQERRPE